VFYREFIPHPALLQHIKCFWVFENSYGDNHYERMIPDGFIDLVYHYGQRPRLVINGLEVNKPSNFLGGHLVNAALLHFSGELKMFGIKFYPWASAALYKMPAYELNNIRIPVTEILGGWVREYDGMMQQELNKGNYRFVIQQLETVLLKKLTGISNQQQVMKYCFEKISASHGAVSVDAVSRELGYSSRFIQKIFRNHKGKSFQHHCRLSRLHYALQYSNQNNKLKYTELAYEAGYYDQSHFIKDFTSFTGLSPSAFFAQENSYIRQHTGAVSGIN
jgi:AraC-like DNA-binding protein